MGVEQKNIMMRGAWQTLGNCRRCDLCHTRKNIVWGGGNVNAPIMLVTGNVNFFEDREGVVLSGDSGALVAEAMRQVGLVFGRDIYAAPAVKCQRPQIIEGGEKTRAATTPEQIAACRSFINWQIAIVKPAILVAHGRLAAEILFGENQPHVAYCGSWRTWGKKTIALATHNPAGLTFGERQSLQPEYMLHWRGLAERLNLLGRLWRPDAECFQDGWSYTPISQQQEASP